MTFPFSLFHSHTMTENLPYLIVGLGNPGREYKDTRHNMGFMLIDRLTVRLNARGMKVQSKAIVITSQHENNKIILAKPQTFMNLSGQSVQGLLRFYKIPLENLLVVSDDIDLPFGVLRIRPAAARRDRRAWRRSSSSWARRTSRACAWHRPSARPHGRRRLRLAGVQQQGTAGRLRDPRPRADAALTFVTQGLNAA